MRLIPHSPTGNSADSGRHLERGHSGRALADGYGDRFARIPFLAEVMDLPAPRRHHAFCLVWKINPGSVPVADHFRISGYVVDIHAITYVVEERVAGLD